MTNTHPIRTTAAVILSLAASGAPAATARPIDDPALAANRAPAGVYSRPDKQVVPVAAPHGGGIASAADARQAVVRIQAPQGGFAWDDAAIGAAGGIGFAMLVTGGGLVLVRTRRDHLDTVAR